MSVRISVESLSGCAWNGCPSQRGIRTVERLMRRAGLQGIRRGQVVRTTVAGDKSLCPLDRVQRQFQADRPNQLWVSDFTYVSTWQGCMRSIDPIFN